MRTSASTTLHTGRTNPYTALASTQPATQTAFVCPDPRDWSNTQNGSRSLMMVQWVMVPVMWRWRTCDGCGHIVSLELFEDGILIKLEQVSEILTVLSFEKRASYCTIQCKSCLYGVPKKCLSQTQPTMGNHTSHGEEIRLQGKPNHCKE